eukprot:scaffold5318_cov113-Skeletonema_menzelii.AAC.1
METRSQERIKEETITAIGYLPALTKTTKLSDVSTYTLCLLQHVGMQDSNNYDDVPAVQCTVDSEDKEEITLWQIHGFLHLPPLC